MKKDKGFTLVELSIVLVIIGLLIGGILVGQSLIESVKLTRFVSLLNQITIASEQFESRYGQIPGDSTLFANPGNNDGQIDSVEAGRILAHLNDAIIPELTTKYSFDGFRIFPNFVDFAISSSPTGTYGNGKTLNFRSSGSLEDPSIYFTFTLDAKIDDGLAAAGTVFMDEYDDDIIESICPDGGQEYGTNKLNKNLFRDSNYHFDGYKENGTCNYEDD